MSQPNLPFWSIPPGLWKGETVVILGGGGSLTREQVDHVRGKRVRIVAVNKAYQLAPDADMLWGTDCGRFWQWCGGPGRLRKSEPDALEFAGEKVTLWSPDLPGDHGRFLPALAEAGVKILRHRGDGWHTGLELEPGRVRGNNAIAQLLSSVVPQAGPRRVILLGCDMVRRESGGRQVNGRWHELWPDAEPHYESQSKQRCHLATISVGGRTLELGWFDDPVYAEKTARRYQEHVNAGCLPQPELGLHGLIPRFATFAVELERQKIEVVNCSPGSAVTAFRQARLEDELP